MHIDHPVPEQTRALKQLWAEAFGDSEDFIDLFFRTAFSPRRCLCIACDDQITAALYWLDCEYRGQKLAYLYAVATAAAHRGRGLCRDLMTRCHEILRSQGYAGTVLVPGEPGLFGMYGKMGYTALCCMDTISCKASGTAALRPADPQAFARARSALLPPGGVKQEMGLNYLAGYAELYTGAGFTLAGTRQGNRFTAMELLGDISAAPGILGALGLAQGSFRIPGSKPFAMYRPLSDSPAPAYFGLALD